MATGEHISIVDMDTIDFGGNLAAQLEASFNQFGASMMRDDFAAKLLAYVYVMGDENKAVVLHQGLHAGIRIAQQKFNLYGGEVPSAVGVRLLQKYIPELERKGLHCPWLSEIEKRYNLNMGLQAPDYSEVTNGTEIDLATLIGLL